MSILEPARNVLLGALCLLAAAPAAAAGGEGPPLELGFSDEASVAWVLVPVVVRGSGGYVRSLGAESFRLWVDGREVAIESFDSGSGTPTAVLYLQDLSGSMAMGGKLAASTRALTCLLDRAREGDRLAVATFSFGEARVVASFGSDPRELRALPEAWRPYGETALHDAIAALPELHTARGSYLRPAVVLVTDGADNASSLAPEAARDLLRRAELPVYVLALGREEGEGSARLLRELAAASGGRYFAAPEERALRRACATLTAELQHQYVLGFRTVGTGERAYRRIRVELGPDSGVAEPRIVHRRGYSGEAPL